VVTAQRGDERLTILILILKPGYLVSHDNFPTELQQPNLLDPSNSNDDAIIQSKKLDLRMGWCSDYKFGCIEYMY
jgi:hypothetical protein